MDEGRPQGAPLPRIPRSSDRAHRGLRQADGQQHQEERTQSQTAATFAPSARTQSTSSFSERRIPEATRISGTAFWLRSCCAGAGSPDARRRAHRRSPRQPVEVEHRSRMPVPRQESGLVQAVADDSAHVGSAEAQQASASA